MRGIRHTRKHAEDLRPYPRDGPESHGPICNHQGQADGLDEGFLCTTSARCEIDRGRMQVTLVSALLVSTSKKQ